MRWQLTVLILLAGCTTTERNYPVARFEGTGKPQAVARCIYNAIVDRDPLNPPLRAKDGKTYRVYDDPGTWGSIGAYDISVGPGPFGSLVILRAKNDYTAVQRVIVDCLKG
ncbi:MAG: hypothetical protein JNM20_01990 [Rhizobiales bacterium]|nr:hypothetical protein [Hyphomicrobiales bacterium]